MKLRSFVALALLFASVSQAQHQGESRQQEEVAKVDCPDFMTGTFKWSSKAHGNSSGYNVEAEQFAEKRGQGTFKFPGGVRHPGLCGVETSRAFEKSVKRTFLTNKVVTFKQNGCADLEVSQKHDGSNNVDVEPSGVVTRLNLKPFSECEKVMWGTQSVVFRQTSGSKNYKDGADRRISFTQITKMANGSLKIVQTEFYGPVTADGNPDLNSPRLAYYGATEDLLERQ